MNSYSFPSDGARYYELATNAVNAILYSKGLDANEIAHRLKKSVKTIKNQLDNARKRLHLDRTRDLIKIFSVYNITLWE